MTREERLRILGPETVAEIHRRIEAVPPPPPALLDELRGMFAPTVQMHTLASARTSARGRAA